MCALLWRKKPAKENGTDSDPMLQKLGSDADTTRPTLGPEIDGFLPGRAWGLR